MEVKKPSRPFLGEIWTFVVQKIAIGDGTIPTFREIRIYILIEHKYFKNIFFSFLEMKATEMEKMEIPSRTKLFRQTNSKKKNPSRKILLLTMTIVTILIGAQILMRNQGEEDFFKCRVHVIRNLILKEHESVFANLIEL